MRGDYVEVEVVLLNVREKAIQVVVQESDEKVWIARSCIHGVDERDLDSISTHQTISIRVFRWLAEKEGLI